MDRNLLKHSNCTDYRMKPTKGFTMRNSFQDFNESTGGRLKDFLGIDYMMKLLCNCFLSYDMYV